MDHVCRTSIRNNCRGKLRIKINCIRKNRRFSQLTNCRYIIVGCVLKLSSGEEDFLLRTARVEEMVPPGKELCGNNKAVSKLRRIELNMEAHETMLNSDMSCTREKAANINGMRTKHGMLYEDYKSHIKLKVGNWIITKSGTSRYFMKNGSGFFLRISKQDQEAPHITMSVSKII